MTQPLLQVDDLTVEFAVRQGLRRPLRLRALDRVGFELAAGETLGVVGESGSGKSTLARSLLRLIPARSGNILLDGEKLHALRGEALRCARRHVQMVFQDPLASLDPRQKIGAILTEPLDIFATQLTSAQRRTQALTMLQRVGLPEGSAECYPHQFSGGQCQRIAIARAMMLRPKLLVCDEPVSSLDVSIQGQIINLLVDLQREFQLALVFISHNLAVVRHISQQVLVLYLGRVMELSPTQRLFAAPRHPYTQALLRAIPRLEVAVPAAPLAGEMPSPMAPPSGCVFGTRCVHVKPECAASVPSLEVDNLGAVSCRRWRQIGIS
jgi:oligopeptide/dipeptide ABC transporter ATP-binding protein